MYQPIVVTIEHHSTKDEVKRKLRDSFGDIRAQITPFVSSVDEQWTDDGVDVRVITLAQTITSRIEVDDTTVRITVTLPGRPTDRSSRAAGRHAVAREEVRSPSPAASP